MLRLSPPAPCGSLHSLPSVLFLLERVCAGCPAPCAPPSATTPASGSRPATTPPPHRAPRAHTDWLHCLQHAQLPLPVDGPAVRHPRRHSNPLGTPVLRSAPWASHGGREARCCCVAPPLIGHRNKQIRRATAARGAQALNKRTPAARGAPRVPRSPRHAPRARASSSLTPRRPPHAGGRPGSGSGHACAGARRTRRRHPLLSKTISATRAGPAPPVCCPWHK